MSTFTGALGRAVIAAGAALAIGSATLLGAAAANASGSDTGTNEIIAANSGTVLVRLPGDAYASATVVVIAPVPGTGELRVESAPVEPEADADGYVAQVSNFAGPVLIEIDNGSAVGDTLAETAEPEFVSNAAVFRGITVEYSFDPETGEFTPATHSGPTAPDSSELGKLLPYADYTFTPTSYEKGKEFTIKFRDIVSLVDGHRIGEEEPHPVDFYGYSAPTLLSSTAVIGGAVDFAVPAAYTTAPHEIAAFDEFGRLNLWVTLDGGIASPVNDPAQGATKPALADTGAGEQSGAVALGLITLTLGAGAIVAGVALRRRKATV